MQCCALNSRKIVCRPRPGSARNRKESLQRSPDPLARSAKGAALRRIRYGGEMIRKRREGKKGKVRKRRREGRDIP